jgi:hypothetical protein
VNADLPDFRLRHSLEGQPWLVIEARANGGPVRIVAMLVGGRDVQQRASKGRQPCGVRTVDRDSSQAICCHAYLLTLRRTRSCAV